MLEFSEPMFYLILISFRSDQDNVCNDSSFPCDMENGQTQFLTQALGGSKRYFGWWNEQSFLLQTDTINIFKIEVIISLKGDNSWKSSCIRHPIQPLDNITPGPSFSTISPSGRRNGAVWLFVWCMNVIYVHCALWFNPSVINCDIE